MRVHGKQPAAQSGQRQNPSNMADDLQDACWRGHVDAAQSLLEKGADVNRAMRNGRTPLWIACDKGHVDVARLLLDKGADVNRAMKDGATPLFVACQEGRVDAVRLLLDKGADVNKADGAGVTPLWTACWFGRVEAARLLLDNGADIQPSLQRLSDYQLEAQRILDSAEMVALLRPRIEAALQDMILEGGRGWAHIGELAFLAPRICGFYVGKTRPTPAPWSSEFREEAWHNSN